MVHHWDMHVEHCTVHLHSNLASPPNSDGTATDGGGPHCVPKPSNLASKKKAKKELEKIGYRNGTDIRYINYEDGKHDVKTWGKAMPDFLKWGWGKSVVSSQ